MYLLDTDALSALRNRRRSVRWLTEQNTADLYLSVVTIGEVERGIARQERHNPAVAFSLSLWLGRVLDLYGDRILPVDLSIARRWGRLSGALGHKNIDLLIAATAIERDLTVVTRNVRHFEPTGVPVIDPFRI